MFPVSPRLKSWLPDIQAVVQLQPAVERLVVSRSALILSFSSMAGETTAPAGLTGALNMSLHELEKMLERLLAQKQRKEYR